MTNFTGSKNEEAQSDEFERAIVKYASRGKNGITAGDCDKRTAGDEQRSINWRHGAGNDRIVRVAAKR